MKHLISVLFFLLAFVSGYCATPIDPVATYTEVKAKWIASDMAGLSSYIVQLEADAPKGVAVVILSAFRDAVFLGKIKVAKIKLEGVIADSLVRPNLYPADFVDALKSMIKELDFEIAMHARHGTSDSTLEANASAMAVRNAWGTDDFPTFILVLQETPVVELP